MRNENMDALKGFGILLVVIGHVCTGMTGLIHWIYSFHMPLFFMISGYIEEEKEKMVGEIPQYIIKKAKTLLYPYIVFSILFSVGLFIRLFSSGNLNVMWKTIYMRVFGIRIPENHIGAIWFLIVLFWAEVIAHYLKIWKKEWMIYLVAMVGSYWATFDKEFQLPFLLEDAFLAVVFVYIGKLIKRYNLREWLLENKNIFETILILVAIGGIHFYAAIKNSKIDMYSFECGNIFLFWIASIFGGMLFILLFTTVGNNYKWHILNRVGRESLIIMATHWYINTILCATSRIFLNAYFLRGGAEKSSLMILWSFFLVGICYFISLFIKRYCPFLILCPTKTGEQRWRT